MRTRAEYMSNTTNRVSMKQKTSMTPLQIVVSTLGITVLIVVSVNSVIAYSSDRNPDETQFTNAQTMELMN